MAFISIDTLTKKATIAGTEKIPVSPTEYIDISSIAEFAKEQSGGVEPAAKTTQVVAGAGLTGGGTLESDRTLNVESANDGITVNADNIQLNVVDNLTSTSATQPLSANQGKMLDAAKVDKITGKGLSTEDYTTDEKSKVANVPSNTNTELGLKVDKVTGKGLSTEDYTTAEKSKVANAPLNTNDELLGKMDKSSFAFLSEQEYNTLVLDDLIDTNVVYMIYEV